MWKRILLGCAVLFFLTTACAPRRAQAQFIGYTSPQTVQRITHNAVAAPSAVIVPNIGQSLHYLTYVASGSCVAGSFRVRIEASNDGITFFPISEDAIDLPSNFFDGVNSFTGGTFAAGYFPVVRVNLAQLNCAPAVTVTVSYSGTSSSLQTSSTIFQQTSPYRKIITLGTVTSAAFVTFIMPTPFGNSGGSIWAQCSAACAAGGVISVFASPTDQGIGSVLLQSFTVAAAGTLQRFDVLPVNTNRLFIGITPTAASANTWTIVYQFNPSPVVLGTGTAATQVQGTTVPAAALVSNPVPIAGTDSGGLVRTVRTDTGGLLVVKSSVNSTVNTSFNTTNSVPIEALNGTTTLPLAVASFGTAANGAAPGGNPTQVAGLGSGATNGFINSITACDSFVNVNVNTISTTLLITGVAARHVRICNYNFLTAAANNVALISGTGATCGTGTTGMNGGTTAATGWNFAANGGLTQGSGLGEINRTNATGDSVCIVTSAAVQLSGRISYAIY